MMRRDVRVGVVGYGSIGRHHARNLAAMPGVTLVGIADRSAEARALAADSGHATFGSSKELIAAGLDAAVVSVPTSLHEEVAMEFVDRDIALLVEKPVAHRVDVAKRLIQACQDKHVPLMIGYVERYNPAIEAMRAFISDGTLGRLISVSARRVGIMPPRISDANVLVDIGVHDIDLVAFITNARLHLVSAVGGNAVLDDRLDYAMLMLSFNGCVASIESNWITPVKVRELSITGTNGFLHVDYITQQLRFAPAQSFEPTPTYEALVAQYVAGTLVDIPVQRREPLARELEVFIAGVRGETLPDPWIAIASLRIAEEATSAIARAKRLSRMRSVSA